MLRQRLRQPLQSEVIRRQAETQQIGRSVETPAPDVVTREKVMQRPRVTMPYEAKQRRTSGNGEAGCGQNFVELARLLVQGLARAVGPATVAQSGTADRKGGARAGPRTDGRGDALDHRRLSDRESQPESRKTKKFSERAQHDHRMIVAQRNRTALRDNVGESFVNDQPAVACMYDRGELRQCSKVENAPVGIVRVDDDDVADLSGKLARRGKADGFMAGERPRCGVLAIGRRRNGNAAGRGEARQPLDQRLCPGSDCEGGAVGHLIRCTRSIAERILVGTRRQPLPQRRREIARNGPWVRIDAGGQIEPVGRRAAVARHRFRQIAAVLHGRFMPSFGPKREGGRRIGAVIAATIAVSGLASAANAEKLPRIASINACTDQLVLALADPDQILGLGPYSRDPERSFAAEAASRYPRLSGEAEDVLALKPDVVVAGSFTKLATRELLKAEGLHLVTFDVAHSVDDAKAQLREMGALVHHPDRAAAQIARIDAAIARAHAFAAATGRHYRVLPLSRRGWVAGRRSLISSLLAEVGLRNVAGELGLDYGGFASLEAIIKLHPDFLLVSSDSRFADDEGRAFLLHPALEHFYPPNKRLVVPERLTVCGGVAVADALDRLIGELKWAAHAAGAAR